MKTCVVGPKLCVTEPDQTFQRVTDLDQTLKSYGSTFGSDLMYRYLLFLQKLDFKVL
jgi:hypothetical protein